MRRHPKRVLLKLSGEALAGGDQAGLDHELLRWLAEELAAASREGVQIGLVVGGGNFLRGAELAKSWAIDRVTGDRMGMLATVMNGMALCDALSAVGQAARLFGAFSIGTMVEGFEQRAAVAALEAGTVVVLVGGTGHPFFTTDTCASLRAVELAVARMLKATKVDGVYSSDPLVDPSATRFERLTHEEVLRRDLRVMDGTAAALCREHQLPILVFDLLAEGNLARALRGHHVGTLVTEEMEE